MRRFRPAPDPSPFRRIAASMWKAPRDPSIYGFVDIDVSETLAFIDAFRDQTGKRLTLTHLVSQAVAEAFGALPELNAKVRFGGQVTLRERVDLVISVATGGGRDLSAARVNHADALSLEELVTATQRQVERTRKGEDEDYEKSRNIFGRLPFWCARPLLWLTDVVSNELQLDLPSLGMPVDPFGTAVITNVGSFGIDTAFAPFVPLGRAPLLLLITEVKDRPMVVNGEVVARPVLRLCATFDHRVIDGAAAGKLSTLLTERIAHPRHEGVTLPAPGAITQKAA